ncbi:peptidase inhibitor family I36 protein [Streptomyces sp. NPDC020883]|uniref:peptidase inhibitor family I36 protein n=1 Tax=Streptomyces sp. NPDC020883 TaxID=3365099 RepID=UPI00378E1768
MISKHVARTLLAAVSAGAFLFTSGPVAQADEPTTAPAATATDSPTPGAKPSKPVIAEYQGRQINLAEDWEGATSCTELPNGKVHCYDTDEEALADPALPASTRQKTLNSPTLYASPIPANCFADLWCLYDHANYKGKVVRLSSNGNHDLKEWGFRDRLSSVFYFVGNWTPNYGRARIWDLRSGLLHNRQRDLTAPARYSNLANLEYPGGGNWNDKVDIFQVIRP